MNEGPPSDDLGMMFRNFVFSSISSSCVTLRSHRFRFFEQQPGGCENHTYA